MRAPNAAFAFTDSRAINEDGATLWADHKAYYGQGVLASDAVFDGATFLRQHLAERNLILNASAVLWRRTDLLAALRRCGPDLQRLRVAGDWRVYAEVLAREGAQVAYVARPLNHHRRHGASVTARMSPTAHIAEVARVHAAVARLLGPTPSLQRRQREYRRSLAKGVGGDLRSPAGRDRTRHAGARGGGEAADARLGRKGSRLCWRRIGPATSPSRTRCWSNLAAL